LTDSAGVSVDITTSIACGNSGPGTYSATVDACALADGPVSVQTEISDGVNPPVSDNDSVTANTTGPSVSQTPPGNITDAGCNPFTVAGTCVADGETVTITLADSAGTGADITTSVACGNSGSGTYSASVDA